MNPTILNQFFIARLNEILSGRYRYNGVKRRAFSLRHSRLTAHRSPFTLRLSVLGLTLLAFGSTHAQNLDAIGIKKGIKMSGSISANTVMYTTTGDERRDPFNWFLNGNLNVNFFGYDMPFSFSYSNAAKSYTQPFNQIRIAPKYKWARAYIGDASMSFSNYTLAGHLFNGVGIELTPGKWNISAMSGRLQKAVAYDPIVDNQNSLAYKRMGYGAKVGYRNNSDSYELIFFTAKDNPNSLLYVPQEVQLSPMQNLAVSAVIKQHITKYLFADLEYAVSALNTDTRASKTNDSATTLPASYNFLSKLFPKNGTTRYYDAVNAGIGYNGKWYTLQLRYERIAPGYQTLGAYYFTNDMQNITIAPNVRLFKNKLNINGNLGFQKNNLDHSLTNDTKRFVGNVTLTYAPNEYWNYTGAFSNFSTYTNARPQTDPFFQNQLDSLNFYQVTSNINGGVTHNFGNKNIKQSVMVNMSYQTANQQSGGTGTLSTFINGNLIYNYAVLPSSLTLTGAFNYNTNNAGGLQTVFYGPNLNVSKGMMKKQLRLIGSCSYNAVTAGGISSGNVLNTRAGVNYTPAQQAAKKQTGRHNLAFNVNWMDRMNATQTQSAYNEWTTTLNYTYSF